MHPVIRDCSILVVAVLAVAAAGSAAAESRLFSVRTGDAGVSIVTASRNGQPLAMAGQSDGATFFRIDNPAGPVPCANTFHFGASNGSSVDTTADLCSNNWTLTVAVDGTSRPMPAPAPSTGSATIPSAGQALAIATDDPDVTITDVFVAGRELPIAGRQDPYVEVMLPAGASGSQCSRDLGLTLSDGRRVARQVDVCQSNNVVVVSLVGGPPPPAVPPSLNLAHPPATIQPLPPAPPPPMAEAPLPPVAPLTPVAPPLTPVVSPPPPSTADIQWLFSAPGGAGTLAFAVPGSGPGAFSAVCTPRSGNATVTLGGSAPEVRPGGYVKVGLAAGPFHRSYSATGSQRSEADGLSHPVLRIGLADPLWASLITERALNIGIGTSAPVALSLAGSSVQVKQFLALCNPQAATQYYQPPPDQYPVAPDAEPGEAFPAPPGYYQPPQPLPRADVGSAQMSYACDDGSGLGATFSGNTAAVFEPGMRPIVLYRAPSRAGQRYVAGGSQLIGEGENIYWTRAGEGTRTCSPQ
ncbi:MAG TPA: MliC family protein [Bauldia sp.]